MITIMESLTSGEHDLEPVLVSELKLVNLTQLNLAEKVKLKKRGRSTPDMKNLQKVSSSKGSIFQFSV